MENSSEYLFPIFISSTDYNLIDLRAELAQYLKESGYRPILSSSAGFPDNCPDLEPWESCLQVLKNCFVMVLIIDGKYGQELEWPHFNDLLSGKKISPTHGEYLYAHKYKKKMFVFIRRDVLTHYQTYQTSMQKASGNITEAEKSLSGILPSTIDFKTLQFIEEVKTSKPIPWIKSFDDVTSIKQEIQKKLLNELVEIFLIKSKRLEIVTNAFSTVLNEQTPEKRNEILQSIGVTRELMTEIEKRDNKIQELKTQEDQLKANLETAKSDINKGKKTIEEKQTLEKKVKKLTEEQTVLERKIAEYEKDKASVITSGLPLYSSPLGGASLYGHLNTLSGIPMTGNINLVDPISMTPHSTVDLGLGCATGEIYHSTINFDDVSSSGICNICNQNQIGGSPMKRCRKCNTIMCCFCSEKHKC